MALHLRMNSKSELLKACQSLPKTTGSAESSRSEVLPRRCLALRAQHQACYKGREDGLGQWMHVALLEGSHGGNCASPFSFSSLLRGLPPEGDRAGSGCDGSDPLELLPPTLHSTFSYSWSGQVMGRPTSIGRTSPEVIPTSWLELRRLTTLPLFLPGLSTGRASRPNPVHPPQTVVSAVGAKISVYS